MKVKTIEELNSVPLCKPKVNARPAQVTVEAIRKALSQFYSGPENNDYYTAEDFFELALELMTPEQRREFVELAVVRGLARQYGDMTPTAGWLANRRHRACS